MFKRNTFPPVFMKTTVPLFFLKKKTSIYLKSLVLFWKLDFLVSRTQKKNTASPPSFPPLPSNDAAQLAFGFGPREREATGLGIPKESKGFATPS